MESSRKQRWRQLQSVFEPGFKQMLLVSVLLHLLVPAIFYAPFFPKREVKKPPVYRVNLVNKIVKNPQAGRPEATPAKVKKTEVAKKPQPKPKPKPVPVKPKPKPKPKPVPAKPKPEPKPQPKPKPKAVPEKVKPEPVVTKAQESALQKRLEQLRAAQEKKAQDAARKKRIEELKSAAAAEVETSRIKSPVDDAPVGMIGAKGDEAGVDAVAFVQEFIRQQWSFSKYQAGGNPEAEVTINYNADGTLIHYKFMRTSGNEAFDESLRRAIAKSRQLPQGLPERMTFEIVFNLKDMLER